MAYELALLDRRHQSHLIIVQESMQEELGTQDSPSFSQLLHTS